MFQRYDLKNILISASVALLLMSCSNKIAQQDVSLDSSKQSSDQNEDNGAASTPSDDSALDSDQLPDNSSTIVDQPIKGNDTPKAPNAPSQQEGTPVANQPAQPLPTSDLPASQLPASQQPVSQLPASQLPTSQQPTSQLPESQLPTSQLPSSQLPTSQPTTGQPPVVGQQPQPPVVPPISQEDEDCINWALADAPEAAASCLKQNPSDSPKSAKSDDSKKEDKDEEKNKSDRNDNEKEVKNEHKDKNEKVSSERCYVKPEEDKDDIDYDSLCRLNKKQIKFLNLISNVLKVFKLRGMTVLTPESVGSSSLDSLEDARGTIILCGLKVGKINDTRGKLVAIDSTIETFSNHRGKAVFINTKAENCSDIKGKFVLWGAQSSCKNIEHTKGLIEINRN